MITVGPKRYLTEPAKKVPIKQDVDVVVIGAGPSGTAAAINAAREGAETLLIEQFGSVGGIATTGLMSHWAGSVQGGFFEELIDRSIDCFKEDGKVIGGVMTINTEKLKSVYIKMLMDAGVYVQLYTMATDVIIEGEDKRKINAIVTESKSGRAALVGNIFIDATGDGDIAAKAGVPYEKGRDKDGKMQPMTLMFKVGGVDMKKAVLPGSFESNLDVPAGKIQDLGKKHLPQPAGHVLLYPSSLPGIVTVNMTNSIGVDGTKSEDLTKAHMECQLQIAPIVNFLRKYVPGFTDCYTTTSGSMVGVRESRRFKGLYTLTGKDILNARAFDDWAVPRAHFNFDIHNIEGSGLDKNGVQKKFKQHKPYSIPYRCFIPENIDNLYLTGRNISGTHVAQSNYRVMPICTQMGEAVGISAALCIRNQVSPTDLDVTLLQKKLKDRDISPPS
ncbi:MAG: FAD-dependent oxidoreductase [Candidatus Lokiarchaeota archaeon]|nr:FAD-dependent oxidoreductase [Candidatus Lokiarchaeota archaeon]